MNTRRTAACLLLLACRAVPGQSTISGEDGRTQEIRELRLQLQRITQRLDALEAAGNSAPAPVPVPAAPATEATAPAPTEQPGGVTVGFSVDGYYGYNFNHPVGRVNLLRAYDVSSNSFSLNQAGIVIERLPTPELRIGGRLDLQFGQATEALQGSSANEQRPQVYRNLFQAYGSYLAPVGSGLQIDFGKFSSALGMEGNYTKDQVAYSRSYSFNFLPYYHMGVRASYALSPRAGVTYWLVNGAQQTEDFNGFKSQAFLFTLKPASSVTWNVNYYFGQEQRDVLATLNPGQPSRPTQPGLPTTNVSPAPDGREHIFDTYASWNATGKLTLAGEADFVINRVLSHSRPSRAAIGAVYARYAVRPAWNVAGRFEYFDDRGGLFSGNTQALKEVTLVADHTFAGGFLTRAEYRRDFSNQRFFLSDQSGSLRRQQTTATIGLVYWWGTKSGAW